jgi:hypothetical protein
MYAFCGASYQFIKYYQSQKDKKDEDDDDEDDHDATYNDIEQNVRHHQKSNLSEDGKKRSRCSENSILISLFILGIFVQPLYLLFKFIEFLMECYRRYGCWFYYFSSNY